jgi:23S rRNA (cytidine1920-2'-O)/16S rRNA (cytidine1409-2'-O)-methyltransferase
MRADQLLVERGLAASRSQAVRLIAGGMRWRDAGTSDAWRSVVKNNVGQSTGGFTDCLLQRGATKVVGVDVGHGQLHAKLREDERVVAIEGVNARALSPDDLEEEGESRFDLIVGDLSFISLTLVLPAVVEFLADDGRLLLLVKPQFELQPGQVGKGGIVRDETMYAVVEKRLRDACEALDLRVLQWFDSPIAGGDGNREFFIHAVRADAANGS